MRFLIEVETEDVEPIEDKDESIASQCSDMAAFCRIKNTQNVVVNNTRFKFIEARRKDGGE